MGNTWPLLETLTSSSTTHEESTILQYGFVGSLALFLSTICLFNRRLNLSNPLNLVGTLLFWTHEQHHLGRLPKTKQMDVHKF